MFTRIKSQTPFAIVTLEEAKRQLNIIDSTEDDVHIQNLIYAASELAQKYTKRMLSNGSVELVFYGKKNIFLPYGNATETDNPITVLMGEDPVTFEFEEISQVLRITDGGVTDSDKIIVTYEAGYKSDDVPHTAKMGTLMIIDSLFNNRGDTVVGASVNDIPLSSTAILDSIKINGAP